MTEESLNVCFIRALGITLRSQTRNESAMQHCSGERQKAKEKKIVVEAQASEINAKHG